MSRKKKVGTRTPVVPVNVKPDPAPPGVIVLADPEPAKRQIIVREEKREVCARCGSTNRFHQSSGLRPRGSLLVASARCRACGHIAQIRIVPKQSI
jgi:hypothetical protein